MTELNEEKLLAKEQEIEELEKIIEAGTTKATAEFDELLASLRHLPGPNRSLP